MRRREFMAALGGGISFVASAARAQDVGRTYRLGVLSVWVRDVPSFAAFFDELRGAGFVEDRNLAVDRRGFARRDDEFPRVAVELVTSAVDAIFCGGDSATRAAQAATRTIPILSIAPDMVASGLVRSLIRPGGNTTGVSILSTELDSKRQEILMELLPGSRRMAALADTHLTGPPQIMALQAAARTRGVELSVHLVGDAAEIAPAIDAARAAGADALNVLAAPTLNAYRQRIIERCAALRLPAIFPWPETVELGGLLGYGPRFISVYRQIARQLVKVLRGARPADIPAEQPTVFELVVNLATARALDLAVPAALLARADAVIE